jgi:hypothetical protein
MGVFFRGVFPNCDENTIFLTLSTFERYPYF